MLYVKFLNSVTKLRSLHFYNLFISNLSQIATSPLKKLKECWSYWIMKTCTVVSFMENEFVKFNNVDEYIVIHFFFASIKFFIVHYSFGITNIYGNCLPNQLSINFEVFKKAKKYYKSFQRFSVFLHTFYIYLFCSYVNKKHKLYLFKYILRNLDV